MEFENKLYKESNLEANDSVSTYNGWGAQQNPYAFETFFNFIKEVQPSVIFEIGTALGGFTQFLNYTCKLLGLETRILSFDILDRNAYRELRESGIEVYIQDIFKNDYTELEEKFTSIIQSPGTAIVLCDGGDKVREFNLISSIIKPGDYILAHDYAIDRDTFENEVNKKLWNWFEIQESDIAEACILHKLKDYNREIFNKAVWVCKIKENE